MGRLIQEYTQLLAGDGLGSDKFWELEKRIRMDRKSVGVVADMQRRQESKRFLPIQLNITYKFVG